MAPGAIHSADRVVRKLMRADAKRVPSNQLVTVWARCSTKMG